MYVFDNSPLSNLFKHFYRGRFPTLWQNFEALVSRDVVTSTREVKRELDQYAHADQNWIRQYSQIFSTPTTAELEIIRRIYAIKHFQQNIESKKLQRGGLNADPFVVAKAAVYSGTVVTLESFRPNGAKIPNICQHFGIACIDLEQFMEEQGWKF